MLGREERDDPGSIDISSQIGGQVRQVLLFREADGVIGEKDDRIVTTQALNRVIHVDPELHGVGRGESGAWWTQLHRREGTVFPQPLEYRPS
jgi:hypothetical protein